MSIIKIDHQYISTKRMKGQIFSVLAYDSHRVYLKNETYPEADDVSFPIFYFNETFKEYCPEKEGKLLQLKTSKKLVDNETRLLLLSFLQDGLDELIVNNCIDTQSATFIFNDLAFRLLALE